jgi:transcription antitermination factor NusG
MSGNQETQGLLPAVFEAAHSTPTWWAVYTRHQHEKTVAEALASKGLEVFLPLYASKRKWKDRMKTLQLPLFPCYVFVQGGHERRLPIVTTPGVHMILSRGEQAAIIPDQEIEGVRRTVESRCCVEPHPWLECGERVRVIRGALTGLEGILVRRKNQCRLVLSVEMLMQSVGVEVDASDVAPIRKVSQSFAAEGMPCIEPVRQAFQASR